LVVARDPADGRVIGVDDRLGVAQPFDFATSAVIGNIYQPAMLQRESL